MDVGLALGPCRCSLAPSGHKAQGQGLGPLPIAGVCVGCSRGRGTSRTHRLHIRPPPPALQENRPAPSTPGPPAREETGRHQRAGASWHTQPSVPICRMFTQLTPRICWTPVRTPALTATCHSPARQSASPQGTGTPADTEAIDNQGEKGVGVRTCGWVVPARHRKAT